MTKPALILIGGPTASGKSALALKLARQKNGTIISADAMQIYKGLPILTAQPEASDKKEIPHELYEIAEPSTRSSVGAWLPLAQQAIQSVLRQNRTPILVGGTGLYFKALMEGLAEIPEIPQNVREATEKLYTKLGPNVFRLELAKVDPQSAQKLKPNDRQRLVRAYEVVRYTGKPIGYWQTAEPQKAKVPTLDAACCNVRPILLMPPREELYAACNQRFLKMMENGALDEVRALLALNLDPSLPAMKILGVRELAAYLQNETTYEEAVAKAQQATRNYAKRQLTWFRNQWKNFMSESTI